MAAQCRGCPLQDNNIAMRRHAALQLVSQSAAVDPVHRRFRAPAFKRPTIKADIALQRRMRWQSGAGNEPAGTCIGEPGMSIPRTRHSISFNAGPNPLLAENHDRMAGAKLATPAAELHPPVLPFRPALAMPRTQQYVNMMQSAGRLPSAGVTRGRAW